MTTLDHASEQILIDALRYNEIDTAKTLLSGRKLFMSNKPLSFACRHDLFEMIELIVRINVSCNYAEVLIYACHFKSYNSIYKLLNLVRIDVNAQNNKALVIASKYEQFLTVKLLIDKGADVHARNDKALIWAMRLKRMDIIKLLIDKANGQNKEVSKLTSMYKDPMIIDFINANADKLIEL